MIRYNVQGGAAHNCSHMNRAIWHIIVVISCAGLAEVCLHVTQEANHITGHVDRVQTRWCKR
ncbi:hypothetical protein ASD8599_03923 [Ascidiaceihabitans donghaensis]|uniref:Uncharacterized protein n=1 Tax=Ascidiaceihabitans donghaensis TaxID=1510460 RepID=A0A2R8BPE2_9RHOB|nr:hypothetical protein ASD8599_03923 [Ascidiaceihabitans donghaensis]